MTPGKCTVVELNLFHNFQVLPTFALDEVGRLGLRGKWHLTGSSSNRCRQSRNA